MAARGLRAAAGHFGIIIVWLTVAGPAARGLRAAGGRRSTAPPRPIRLVGGRAAAGWVAGLVLAGGAAGIAWSVVGQPLVHRGTAAGPAPPAPAPSESVAPSLASPEATPAAAPIAPIPAAHTVAAADAVVVAGATAAAPAPTPSAPPTPRPAPTVLPQIRAVELLGAAAAERQHGRLGAALDLARQAVGVWPDYVDGRQFLDEVAAQATATTTAARAQATERAAEAATARAHAAQATAAAAPAAPAAAAAPAPAGAASRPFVYGVTIADASAEPGRSFDLARQAGFTHAYVVIDWANVQPEWGRFAWETGGANDLDNFLQGARAHGLRLVVRLGRPHGWTGSLAQLDPALLERFAAGVAARGRGIAAAYEVLNEPNLDVEWGGPPDPAAYTRLLAAAARGVKRADPEAVVLAAGLAPHTGNQPGTIEDVDFLRGMYAAGARGHFDALGIHPYGGTSAPDGGDPSCGICFRRAERYRQVMVEHGDAATPAWVTELGYLHATGTPLGPYEWLKVSPQQQAGFLVAAFRHAHAHWPWLGGIVVFNLDFATVPWNPPTSGAYWFSLLHPDRSPRPAYTALREMPKPAAPRRG